LCNPCGRYGAKNMYRWIGVETGLNNKLQRHSEWCIECGILRHIREHAHTFFTVPHY
jgi:hypothetical protein